MMTRPRIVLTRTWRTLAAVVVVVAVLAQADTASAYPSPGQTITVYNADCSVYYQQGGMTGYAYAKFYPVAGAHCVIGWDTRVTVVGVKGTITKTTTCYLSGPCASGAWWKAQHVSGVAFLYADLRTCYEAGSTKICRSFHFTP